MRHMRLWPANNTARHQQNITLAGHIDRIRHSLIVDDHLRVAVAIMQMNEFRCLFVRPADQRYHFACIAQSQTIARVLTIIEPFDECFWIAGSLVFTASNRCYHRFGALASAHWHCAVIAFADTKTVAVSCRSEGFVHTQYLFNV